MMKSKYECMDAHVFDHYLGCGRVCVECGYHPGKDRCAHCGWESEEEENEDSN